MLNPCVSVALCTYNGAKWLTEQISTIARQSLPVKEVVLRDDGSVDETVERARAAWLADGRQSADLNVAVQEVSLGVAKNFETALRACTGEFIALSDQDDLWPPNRLAILVQSLKQRHGGLLVHSDANMVGPDGMAIGTTLFQELGATPTELDAIEQGRGWEPLLQRNVVTGATVVMRRELLDLALPIPEYWLHDEWLGLVAAFLGGLVLERRALTDYRRHGNNQVGAKRESVLRAAIRVLGGSPLWLHRQHLRATALLEWSIRHSDRLTPEQLQAIRDKQAHHAQRAVLPQRARWRRVPTIWGEWRQGRYHRFGHGWRGVALDLFG